MPTSTITSNGQTTVPKEVREALDLGPGDRLSWEIRAEKSRSPQSARACSVGKGSSRTVPPMRSKRLRKRGSAEDGADVRSVVDALRRSRDLRQSWRGESKTRALACTGEACHERVCTRVVSGSQSGPVKLKASPLGR